MKMRRIALTVFSLAAVLAAWPGSALAGARPCYAPPTAKYTRDHTIKRTSLVRVYWYTRRKNGDPITVACLLRSGQAYLLGGTESDDVLHIRVARFYVGYAYNFYGSSVDHDAAAVLNLRTGRIVGSDSAVDAAPSGASTYVSDLELKANGSIAWLGYWSDGAWGPDFVEVHKIDSQGKILLDSGTDIPKESLARVDSQISWIKGGEPRSGVLF